MLGSAASKVKSAPSSSHRDRFPALRDSPTTVDPIDFPSCTEAVPTPPDAPVTSSTEPAAAGAGGSLHCVKACHDVRNTSGAAAVCSNVHPRGTGTTLAAGTATFSARDPHVLTPASARKTAT